jgi:virginiamycin B lyase
MFMRFSARAARLLAKAAIIPACATAHAATTRRLRYRWRNPPTLRMSMQRFAVTLLGLLATGMASGQAPETESAENFQVEIREWAVPWEDSRPRDPDVAPNGSVWLVGQGSDYVAHFDPETLEFSRFELPPGTGPHNIIVDRDASLWIAGNRRGFIGRMNPNTGEMARFTMPDHVKDPHTLVFAGRSHIWFTAQWSNFIGRMNKRSGEVELAEVPIERSRPYGIQLDSAGRPWVALLGVNALATVDPETFQLTVIRTPRPDSRLRRIAVTSDDVIWYTDYSKGFLGRYDPATLEFKEWKNPGEESGPYAIAADDQDRVWFVETGPAPNRLVGFDPATESFFSITDVPSGAGAVRHMVFDQRTNSIWFGTDTNNLGQAMLPPPGVPAPPPPEPETPEAKLPGGEARTES